MSTGHAYDDARSAGTDYGSRPWNQQIPRYSYLGPFSSNEERLVQQSLSVMDLPADEIQEVVGPPLPQIDPFPPRFGYDRTVIGINDIINVERNFPTRVSWFSGGIGSYSGTSRDTLGGGV